VDAKRDRVISRDSAPAMGDIRAMGQGETLWLAADASQRRDWPRYVDAIGCAITRGIEVRRL
jgi:hypothetical protein